MWSKSLILVSCVSIALWERATASPLLDTIATVPELSTFSAVLKGTGGKLGKPGPAIEERFNSVLDTRKYTAFVPTNAAFSKIPANIVKILTSASGYELLLAVIRTHIAESIFSRDALTKSKSAISIQGFSLDLGTTNGESTLNGQAKVDFSELAADNGLVQKIDQVINPFTAYFGVSNATTKSERLHDDPSFETAWEILKNRTDLSILRSIIEEVDPLLVERLDGWGGVDGQVMLMAPSNAVFEALPAGAIDSFIQPSNQALVSYLLRHHLAVTPTATFRRQINLNQTWTSIGSGLPLKITAVRDTFRVSNAAVRVENLYTFGGIRVAIIDRFLDPLYLAFGPVNRFG